MSKHRSHKFDKLIKVADESLLKGYFNRKGYVIPENQEVSIDYVNELLDKIEDENKSLDLEEELLCINDIADTSVDRLGEIIEQFNIECDAEESPETTALRVYLHENAEAFDLAYDFYLCDMYSERLNHYPVSCDNVHFDSENIDQFAEDMKKYLEETRKTNSCYIRNRIYQDKYYILIARGEAKKTMLELDGKRMKPRVYRPAKEDVIVYNKEASVLSLSSGRRSNDETKFYVKTFGKHILETDQIDDETFSSKSRLINLEPVLKADFYKRTDDITDIKLRQLFLIHHSDLSTNLVLKSDNVLESLKDLQFSTNGCQLISVKLDFYIEGKKRHTPVHLTTRGSTIIKQRKEKEIIEEFLCERGVLTF